MTNQNTKRSLNTRAKKEEDLALLKTLEQAYDNDDELNKRLAQLQQQAMASNYSAYQGDNQELDSKTQAQIDSFYKVDNSKKTLSKELFEIYCDEYDRYKDDYEYAQEHGLDFEKLYIQEQGLAFSENNNLKAKHKRKILSTLSTQAKRFNLSEDLYYLNWNLYMSSKEKDEARVELASKTYNVDMIYNEPMYTIPICYREFIGNVHIDEDKKRPMVLHMAKYMNYIERINVAYGLYLQKHFPLANLDDQEMFNVIVLALFHKMQSGDICINVMSLLSLFEVIKEWHNMLPYEYTELTSTLVRRYSFGSGEDILNEDYTAEDLVDDLRVKDAHYFTFTEDFWHPQRQFMKAIFFNAPNSVDELYQVLMRSPAVGSRYEKNSPLVLDNGRLYLRRFYQYEITIADYINNVSYHDFSCELKTKFKQALDILFVDTQEQKVNWQKIAAIMSCRSNFSVISGGPGTGKTTTVLRILLLLICLNEQNRKINLCAPTGKAAARMGESIVNQLKDPKVQEAIDKLAQLFNLNVDDIKSYIPDSAVTVQRLLKCRPNYATPIFNQNNKLQCDILVVDEVSMLDMALFTKLLLAIPSTCTLIMLGDKDQLSSVEAGAVLGEICQSLNDESSNRLTQASLDFLVDMSNYAQEDILAGKVAEHTTLLQFSYRSKDVPQIGELANLINDSSLAVQRKLFFKHQHKSLLDLKLSSAVLNGLKSFKQLQQDIINNKLGVGCEHILGNLDFSSPLSIRMLQMQNGNAKDYVLEDDEDNNYMSDAFYNRKDRTYLSTLEASNTSKDEQELIYLTYKEQMQKILQLLQNVMYNTCVQQSAKLNVELPYPQSALYVPLDERLEVHEALKNASMGKYLPPISYIGIYRDQGLIKQFRQEIAKKCVDLQYEDNYAPYLKRLMELNFTISADNKECDEIFKLMDRFRILCSNHNGVLGDQSLNEEISYVVKKQYLKNFKYNFLQPNKANPFFPGQIVLITKNDPVLGVVNGYVGFCAYHAKDIKEGKTYSHHHFNSANLRVFIPVGSEEVNGKSTTKILSISTLMLTHYDTGFAMSIHKSQGSEYDKVTIVLSEQINRVLSKELVYTGITRAKKSAELISSYNALLYAISNSVNRESGLADRIRQNKQAQLDINLDDISNTVDSDEESFYF